MILHLVSDRRRLAPEASSGQAEHCLLTQVRLAVEAGVDVVQIRERDLDAGRLVRLVAAAVRITRGSRTRIVVNERVDVALAAGADGVHLRSDSMAAVDVRRCTPPGFLIGRSVHSVDEALVAGPVDYLLAGTVWATASKPGRASTIGVSGLRVICAASGVPVLAIGGVDAGGCADAARAGAAGAAAIGAFIAGRDPGCRAASLVDVVQRLRERFDTAGAAS
ncbi:MAG: thiamine phosphate synthase [Vicinamibacterales bacterium]